MRNYICKWPNGDLVLLCARDKQEVRQILDEVADPGDCEVVRMKGPFALELLPKLPKPPRREITQNFGGMDNNSYEPPEDPTERPLVMRWVDQVGSYFADVLEAAGGQLSQQEAAALQRWREATRNTTQQQAAVEPWVTREQLQETGMLHNPYHVQVSLGATEYGRYTSRLLKAITKAFYPKTHAALKPLADVDLHGGSSEEAVKALRAAVAADVDNKHQDEERMIKEAKLLVSAQAGDKQAMLALMVDQTANPYGSEEGDDEDDGDSHDFEDSDDGMDFLQAIRAASVGRMAASLGMQPR